MLNRVRGTFVMLGECVRMSLSNIMGSRVRSFLTVLGILIGVAAVIALITTVNGFSESLSNSFNALGAGTLTVTVSGSDLKPGLTPANLAELTALEQVDGVTPSVSLKARVSRSGSYETDVSVSGKNAYYFFQNDALMARGRQINVTDEDNTTFTAIISPDMVEQFFFGVDPLGETLYIDGIPFLVVGIMEEDGDTSIVSLLTGSPDILVPYTTAMKMNSANVVTSFTVYLKDGADSETATDALAAKLDALFSYEEDCYEIMNMSSIEDTIQTMMGMVSALLAGIALVVGGIGIMNMMLTTVTERTTEIGLKKALGAIPWQIQAQFLIESFLLSLIGGILGILLGLLLSLILSRALGTDFTVSYSAIALGAGFSAAVGIIFGWAPARKASKLNPIDALRSA